MWSLIGAPLNSSGALAGEADAPAALRDAGLDSLPGVEDRGDDAARISDSTRDPTTGAIGFRQLVSASEALAGAIFEAIGAGARPLVVGGDCSLLVGVFVDLRRAGLDAGLWMVDGHPDALDGETSPTGEAADMELSFLLGRAPPALAELAGDRPLLDPARVVLLGHRSASHSADAALEISLVPPAVTTFDAPSIVERGAREVAGESAERLEGEPTWLHLDLDVLDESVFPAVSYPQAGGLDWAALEDLLPPLARSESVVGMSVADFNPDRDPDRRHAKRVIAALSDLVG